MANMLTQKMQTQKCSLQEDSSVVVAAIAYHYKQLTVMLQSLHCIMPVCYQSRYI